VCELKRVNVAVALYIGQSMIADVAGDQFIPRLLPTLPARGPLPIALVCLSLRPFGP